MIKQRNIWNILNLQNHYIKTIKQFERLVIDKIEKDKKLAIQIFIICLLINDKGIVERILNVLLEKYKECIVKGHQLYKDPCDW